MIHEITTDALDSKKFIEDKVREITDTVGSGTAINALSGGVDSSVVTALGHRALKDNLRTVFVQNGIMREGEPESIQKVFKGMGIDVEIIDAQDEFFNALEGIIDPEEKREAVTQTFYKDVFGRLVRESGAKYLLQGTILTDVDETVAGIKRQHNVFEQLGIDPQATFGYRIIEPLIQIRKDGVRKVGEALGLPEQVFNRIPFPGPALAARIIGEVTRERIGLVRQATTIVEDALGDTGAFSIWPSCMRIVSRVCATARENSDFRSRSAVGTASMPTKPNQPDCRSMCWKSWLRILPRTSRVW